MTALALLVASAFACLADARLAAALLVATAYPARSSSPAAWAALAGAGLLLTGLPSRRLAVPIIGAGATVAAMSSQSAAPVLAGWAVAAACAAHGSRSRGSDGVRWTAGLLLADLPVVAGVVANVVRRGFALWGPPLPMPASIALVAAAAARAPLAADGPAEGLVLVRAQTGMLLLTALSGAGRTLATGVLLTAAACFAVAGLRRDSVRDALQEAALLAAAICAAGLGRAPSWLPPACMGAFTLVHLVASTPVPPAASPWRTARTLVLGGSLPTPVYGVAAILAAGMIAAGGRTGGLVVLALLAGLAGRERRGPAPSRARRASPPVPAWLLWTSAAAGTALISRSARLPALAAMLIAAGAAAGMARPDLASPRLASRSGQPALRTAPLPGVLDLLEEVHIPDVVVAVGLAAYGLAALGLWVLAWSRGFL
jgi:hypothetical protein